MNFKSTACGSALLVLTVIAAEDGSACTCDVSMPPGLDSTDAVFVGTATGRESSDAEKNATVYTFTVSSSWKGVRRETVAVRTHDVCHVYFELGETYIVYADDDEAGFYTDSCYRQVRIDDDSDAVSPKAKEELQTLGDPVWRRPKKEE